MLFMRYIIGILLAGLIKRADESSKIGIVHIE